MLKLRGRDLIITKCEILRKENSKCRCRTQIVLKVDNAKAFIDKTLGNHHLLVYEKQEKIIEHFELLGFRILKHA